MILAFLIDTSWSMGRPLLKNPSFDSSILNSNTKNDYIYPNSTSGSLGNPHNNIIPNPNTVNNLSRLDCAKGIAEQIVQRLGSQPHDSLKDGYEKLLSEIKNLKPGGRFNGGMVLSTLFQHLRLYRTAYDIDSFGKISTFTGNDEYYMAYRWHLDALNIPVSSNSWSDLYMEPFRWDQKLFTVYMHESGDKDLCYQGKKSCEHLLNPMCTVMNGISNPYHVGSKKSAQKFVDMMCPNQKSSSFRQNPIPGLLFSHGVVVNIEKLNSIPNNQTNQKVVLHTQEPVNISGSSKSPVPLEGQTSIGSLLVSKGFCGYFPIPESFWMSSIGWDADHDSKDVIPDEPVSNSISHIRPRPAHPTLFYDETPVPWNVPSKFPFDKFQIDPNSKTSQLLLTLIESLQKSHPEISPICLPVFVPNSYRANNAGFPFGLLRMNSFRAAVNLYIFPYNFPALFSILRRNEASLKSEKPYNFKAEINEYLSHTPFYYSAPLKRAFSLYGIHKNFITSEFLKSPEVINLNKLLENHRSLAIKEWELIPSSNSSNSSNLFLKKNRKQVVDELNNKVSDIVSNQLSIGKSGILQSIKSLSEQIAYSFSVILDEDKVKSENIPNALLGFLSQDLLPESDLVLGPNQMERIHLMNRFKSTVSDSANNLPISQMGQYYQTMAKRQSQEFRDPYLDEEMLKLLNRNMFGNPYKRQHKPATGASYGLNSQNANLNRNKYSPQKRSSASVTSLSPPNLVSDTSSTENQRKKQKTKANTTFNKDSQSSGPETQLVAKTEETSKPNLNGANDPLMKKDHVLDLPQVSAEVILSSEVESEAQLNNTVFAETTLDELGSDEISTLESFNSRFGPIQKRRGQRRYRTLKDPWKAGDYSWNINPWKPKQLENQTPLFHSGSNNLSMVNDAALNQSQADIGLESRVVRDSIPFQNKDDIAQVKFTPNSQVEQTASDLEIKENIGDNSESEIENSDSSVISPSNNNGKQFAHLMDCSTQKELVSIEDLQQIYKESGQTPVPIESSGNGEGNQGSTEVNIHVKPDSEKAKNKGLDSPISSNTRNHSHSTTLTTNKPKRTTAQLKSYLVKQIKMDTKAYNESLIFEGIEELHPDSTVYTKEQKKAIINACLTAARPLRKRRLVSHLDSLLEIIDNNTS
ncbi:hypothetical protein BB560_006760 [Smittium megazygosporum]|uniref:Integrator complex subunit 6-like beta-barrel domain-containing protein n=1 Tax=Smittium megazygosporum TaxID=133381 RepID=A0A2T9Y203_9FUNG|nr:hypothetical protein BB560_006760 [Smittium megazygosporum]